MLHLPGHLVIQATAKNRTSRMDIRRSRARNFILLEEFGRCKGL